MRGWGRIHLSERAAGTMAALVIVAITAGPAVAGGHSKISKADGSSVLVMTNSSGTIVKTFDRAGKPAGTRKEPDFAGDAGHRSAVEKYKRPGDTVDTRWDR